MCVSFQNLYVEILTPPHVMVLRGETFGRWLGYEGGILWMEFTVL